MAWNFDDFLRRLEAIKGLGSLDELIAQVPGLRSILQDVNFDLSDLDPIERILRAMTPEERRDPRLLEDEAGQSRRERIAEASETSPFAVDSLISQFKSLCEMLESMSPEQVTQELVDQSQPRLEPWQQGPDSWKAPDPEASDAAGRDQEAGAQVKEWLEEQEELTRQRQEQEQAQAERLDREHMDELLRKIGRVGMEGLELHEQTFLQDMSTRLREGAYR